MSHVIVPSCKNSGETHKLLFGFLGPAWDSELNAIRPAIGWLNYSVPNNVSLKTEYEVFTQHWLCNNFKGCETKFV